MPSIKSRRTIPTGDERHNKRKSGHSGRQPQRESARRRSGPSPRRRTSPTPANRNSKPQCGSERSADSHRPPGRLTRRWHRGARVSSVAPREGEVPRSRKRAASRSRTGAACGRRGACGPDLRRCRALPHVPERQQPPQKSVARCITSGSSVGGRGSSARAPRATRSSSSSRAVCAHDGQLLRWRRTHSDCSSPATWAARSSAMPRQRSPAS
jgi:hypothetical protein